MKSNCQLSARCPLGRAGFTLIELLVVITIIGMLVGLLMPALNSARSSARAAQCGNNLHNIGVAYRNFLSRDGDRTQFNAATWTGDLAPHCENSLQLFICPEDSALSSGFSPTCVQGVTLHVNWNPVFDIPFVEGQRCQLKNVQADSFELWFEDNFDWDYNDLRVKVAKTADGKAHLSSVMKNSGATYDIIGSDGKVLMNVTNANHTSMSLDVPYERLSYGVNNRAVAMGSDSNKILALDYRKKIADLVGLDAKDKFSEQVAPRHRRSVNVLFMGGDVARRMPDEIDPQADLSLHDTLWKPLHDPKLSQ